MASGEERSDLNQVLKDERRKYKNQVIWYCPSRWLLAHNDPKANIATFSSHMCLADLNNDGESLLALVDFKRKAKLSEEKKQVTSPYECRMRIYRGQQLIYNHFLEDMPSCLIASNITTQQSLSQRTLPTKANSADKKFSSADQVQQQTLLTVAIMDDLYFYSRLKASHKLSLEDEDCIIESLVKSEVDAWQMVKQNKVDVEAMRELLSGLTHELGNQELTSHSLNFLALDSSSARKQYLVSWKLKKLQNGHGEHLMSMDTICCAAPRLKFNSNITRSGDYGQTREDGSLLQRTKWTRMLDMQKDGLVVGTEDRHLLIYETGPQKSRLECHYRLPAVPDHILVERRSPAKFDARTNPRDLTYKILVSCRNCRIYSIDQLYIVPEKSSPCELRELIALKCNVLDMSWCGVDERPQESSSFAATPSAPTWPLFVAGCLDKRVYCFSSCTGQCKWVIDVELPITCLVCLPKLQIGLEESSLVGVASKASRIDFFVGASGRIVDSIYFGSGDYPEAATYGRFGCEDNCLCLVTHLGHLSIFILKRTAKFAHGQCLSSAASHASDTLASCGQVLQQSMMNSDSQRPDNKSMKLDKPANVPSAFSLTKSASATATDQILDSMLQLDHDCDQVAAKNALEAHIGRSQLQIPVKGRDFVDQIMNQSRHSCKTIRTFANQITKLRDRVKVMMEQQSDLRGSIDTEQTDTGKRVTLNHVIGLGNIYRVSLSVRLNLEAFVTRHMQLFSIAPDKAEWRLVILIYPTQNSFQVKPFRVVLPVKKDKDSSFGIGAIFENSIEFKLYRLSQASSLEAAQDDTLEVQLQILVSHSCSTGETLIRKPLVITSINVQLGQS